MQNSDDMSIDWIKNIIQDFITSSSSNTMENKNHDPAWDDALVGFASGIDPIWQQYKEYIGPTASSLQTTPAANASTAARCAPSQKLATTRKNANSTWSAHANT